MAAKTLLEQFIAKLNANVFFSEFAFSSTELRVPGQGEVEIADHLVLVEELGILFQLKERDDSAPCDVTALQAWFENKVRRKAVKQVRSTRELLSRFKGAKLKNQRGHEVPVAPTNPDELHALVIYRAPAVAGFTPPQYYDSKSAGFVHFIRDVDYLGVCQFLLTPVEIAEYLLFRRESVAKARANAAVSEAALVGQYLVGEPSDEPSSVFENALGALRENPDDWDMSFFMERFGDRITLREGEESETSHYHILAQFAKLTRSELREFKARFRLALDAVHDDRFEMPYRFACPRTNCGFLIIPLTRNAEPHARNALTNLSLASKYDLQVRKHVSLTVVARAPHIDIEWMFAEGANEPNRELDGVLERNYPFRRVRQMLKPRYYFDSAELDESLGKSRPDGG